MATVKISQLPPATGALSSTDVFAAVQGGTTVKATSGVIGYQPAGTSAVATTIQTKLRETVSLQDFGAVGNGVTDDTAAIQAAINSGALQVTGVTGKTYRITSTLTINVTSFQLNLNTGTFLLDDPTGLLSHILVGNGVTQVNGVILSNIIFTRTQIATNGYAINTNYVGELVVNNCRIFGDNKIYGGIRIYQGIIINIIGNYIQNCIYNDVYLQGSNSGAGRTIDVTIRENRIEGSQTGLSTWDFVEGLYCRDNIFFNQSITCVAVSASVSGNALVSFKLQQNDFDTATTGLYVKYINNIQISDNWFSNLSLKCLVIDIGVDGCVIADNEIIPNAVGMDLSGANLTISGNHITGPGVAVMFSAAATNIVLSSNSFQTQTGVDITSNPTKVLIANNEFNVTVGAINGTGGTGTIIEGNLGDPSRGSASNITVGASPFVYTTGPRPETVNIFAGTITNVTVGGVLVAGAVVDAVSYALPPRTSITVTYSVIPLMTRVLL
jgi:hypothetical protein